jgi:hypothetical protein
VESHYLPSAVLMTGAPPAVPPVRCRLAVSTKRPRASELHLRALIASHPDIRDEDLTRTPISGFEEVRSTGRHK